ncbi:MAG: DegT/DnrJ/EryC1/StrS family aminotransferase [Deltaproteobacteria bacterium]|jgi:dTDP-4-amino-4,6-dideoxygalactose transaminase|nr:DegT/DnrJ/EryC1/StrS family aminotransferase [Deltaproteobacteria bacterium]
MKKFPIIIPYFTDAENNAVKEVLSSGWVAEGAKVEKFEELISQHEGIKYGVATTSCTTALHLALVASGLSAGMDVIIPAFTFIATANSVIQAGATPIFVDIYQNTFTINPQLLEKKINEDYEERNDIYVNKVNKHILWGIIPVHLFGLCANMLEINAIAKKYGLKIIEDAACALGAKISNIHQGAFGNVSCLSFHPRKSITTGEGGMILTNDLEFSNKLKSLRSHGCSISANKRHLGNGFLLPEFNEIGFNYRITDLQAAVGIAQFKKLDFIIEERRKKAKFYEKLIKDNLPEFISPFVPESYFHTFQSFVCMLDFKKLGFTSIEEAGMFRNKLMGLLEENGISTRQGTHAVHLLGYYKKVFGFNNDDFPNAFACDKLSITLPLYVQMIDDDQIFIIEKIRDIKNYAFN